MERRPALMRLPTLLQGACQFVCGVLRTCMVAPVASCFRAAMTYELPRKGALVIDHVRAVLWELRLALITLRALPIRMPWIA